MCLLFADGKTKLLDKDLLVEVLGRGHTCPPQFTLRIHTGSQLVISTGEMNIKKIISVWFTSREKRWL